MAPPHKIAAVSRSLVRIPGNGSDTSARPLCLNLARTLTNADGPLGPLVQQSLAQTGEAFVPLVAPFSSSEPREARPQRTGTGETSKSSGGAVTQLGKRARVDKEGECHKSACPANSQGSPAAAVRKSPAVRAAGGDRSTTCESASPADAASASQRSTGGDCVSGNPARAGSPRPVLKPVSVVSQLVETIQDLKRKQEESEREKQQLKEEIELLNKKLATFREIFQDTGKLKAVLRRLNITL